MLTWNASRLAELLDRDFRDESVLVLANREPCRHDFCADGQIVTTRTASGLVTAVEPVVRACGGVWIAHGSGTADKAVVDANDGVMVEDPNGSGERYRLRRVWLAAQQYRGYYEGFANEGLWPLCHDVGVPASFRPADFDCYRAANIRFAQAAVEEAACHAPLIFVHDYHLMLAPRLIRQRLPKSTVVSFWHIPWPSADKLAECPWADALIDGWLGSSIVGFQTSADCERFLEAARLRGAVVDAASGVVCYDGQVTLVRPYPIAVESPSPLCAHMPSPADCRKRVFRRLNIPESSHLVVGVDRLDYTKGIAEKCAAVERLLDTRPEYRGHVVFVQVAEPSRESLPAYQRARRAVSDAAARVNAKYGNGVYLPVVLREAHHEPAEVFEYLRAADVCYVGSLRDGMNLVAKEFVAARTDCRGALLLSRETGAAEQLDGAVLFDPADQSATEAMLHYALRMTDGEQERRMAAMRQVVSDCNLHWWAASMLADAAALRGVSGAHLQSQGDGQPGEVRVA